MSSARFSLLLLAVAADALAASPARLVNPLQPGPFAASSDVETFVAMPGAGKLPSEWEQLWRRGAAAHEDFMREFDAAGGAVTDAAWSALESAAESLEELGQYKLDPVRASMLFGKLVEVYASLSRDDGKCLRAAHWCVQQACTQACVDAYAVDEASPRDAFNAAISSAVTYYRRGGDLARAEAARALANKHPAAATKYDRVDQTPKVYFPGLTAQRFWEPRDFEVVRRLEEAFADESTRAAMLDDLNTLIRHNALKRLVSPSAPFRPPSKDADAEGEGAWSELPLYDGREWDAEACALAPTLSRLLQTADGRALPELGAAPLDPTRPNLCGTPVVATVLRLAPGANILPHCGVTNRRLIMQFALRGSDGVTFTVGDEPRSYGGDGHAIVFDDSFEHHVRHDGAEDRYVLFAILKHPDVEEGSYG
jgi:hypothetical protein